MGEILALESSIGLGDILLHVGELVGITTIVVTIIVLVLSAILKYYASHFTNEETKTQFVFHSR